MRSRLLRPPAAGTAYASSDDDEDAAAEGSGSLPAQWWKEIVTLNIWLGPFRVPRARDAGAIAAAAALDLCV